jgi:signal transduction histidine kinase
MPTCSALRPVRRRLAILAALSAAAAVPVLLATSVGPAGTAARIAAAALLCAQLAVLPLLPARPEPGMAAALVAGAGIQALAPDFGFLGLANFALCVYAFARPPRRSAIALALMLAASPWQLAGGGGKLDVLLAAAGAVIAWSWGELGRGRIERRRSEAARAIAAERARIARELHDVVAHTVSIIVVQATAAEDVLDDRPDQARAALLAIQDAGRSALGELRRLVETVRPDDEAGGRTPQPGLEQLDALVGSVRAAGLAVDVRREGDAAAAVPAGVGLSAYRIVQEALTNTLRHAGATRAAVTVRTGAAGVEIEVEDDGRGVLVGPSGGGNGLLGMRERAALLGGTLEVGPGAGGGFRVHAQLPLRAPR